MRRLLISLLLIACLLPLSLSAAQSDPGPLPPNPPVDKTELDTRSQVEKAILDAVSTLRLPPFGLPEYETFIDNFHLSNDRTWATAWLGLKEVSTGEILAAEPSLAIARLVEGQWRVTLPVDSELPEVLKSLPSELMNEETNQPWLNEVIAAQPQVVPNVPLRGYKLPWAFGRTVRLTRSVGHDASYSTRPSSSHYAFDFADGTLFNIYAAKAGIVWGFKDSVPNGEPSDVNFLVLEDRTTSPTTYQLYLHLAQNSIPPSLKVIGAPVIQGQFIGMADDTGNSTGHHLHFQVESEPYWPAGNKYWAASLDFTFDDVDINGGRPRMFAYDKPYCLASDVCDHFRDTYVSGNVIHGDVTPPTGDYLEPANGITLNSNSIHLSAWASDNDSGLHSAQFIARYNGDWHPIGPIFKNGSFSTNWDLCASQVPDGPVSLALELRDNDGNWSHNLPGLRHFTKNYACSPPPPACIPSANQAALFAEPNFGGECVLLGAGEYTTAAALGALGVNNAASIQVGAGTWATLYAQSDKTARGETFAGDGTNRKDDANLGDNRIGADMTTAVIVRARSTPPSIPQPAWPAAGASYPKGTSLSLIWEDNGGGSEFQANLTGPGVNLTTPWQAGTVWHVGSLGSGAYTWKVMARNSSGVSAWSTARNFTIDSVTPPAPPEKTVPFTDSMENGNNGWANSNNWDQTTDKNHTSGGKISWSYDTGSTQGYDTGAPNTGDLTSPIINIPSSGRYYLRFWYLYETESPGLHWDQRWIQISRNDGAFTNLFQLSDDPPNTWLQSSPIDLAAYAGAKIQVRFHFETLDEIRNGLQGWYIDDFSVNSTAPPNCADADSTPATAAAIAYGASITAKICPNGDVDFYKFNGAAGDQIGVAIDGAEDQLDPYLFLLDGDGGSVLAENDDISANEIKDSFLSYRLPKNGLYYLKIRAWKHPSEGSDAATYTLKLFSGQGDPQAAITAPPSGTFLPKAPFNVTASASDATPGMSRVEFLWHSGDWSGSDWTMSGIDWNGQDGWSMAFDPADIPDQKEMAFYIRAYDLAGNWIGSGSWNLALDRTPPVTMLQPLPDTQNSTAFLLEWIASDNLAGINQLDLQWLQNNQWVNLSTGMEGSLRQTWIVGEAGKEYRFRMRGVDKIGNEESWPSQAEAITTIPTSVCSPGGDSYEGDNSQAAARPVNVGSASETHTFCNPTIPGGVEDEDWFKVTLKAGQVLAVQANPLGNSTAALMELYGEGGTAGPLLAQASPARFGQPSAMLWRASANILVYLRVRHLDERVAGDGVSYQISIQQAYPAYLPVIQ